jgi:hypothetical protein
MEFCARTVEMIEMIPEIKASNQTQAEEVYGDVIGRTMLTKLLITDPGKMAAVMKSSDGSPIDFGDHIREAVEKLAA